MSVTLRRRGKKKLWSYSVKDKKGNTIASKGSFKTKKEAQLAGYAKDELLFRGIDLTNESTLYDLWKMWYETIVLPQSHSDSTLYKHELRGRYIKQNFGTQPAVTIQFSKYQKVLTKLGETQNKDNVRRFNAEVRKVIQFARRDRIAIDDFTEGVIIVSEKTQQKTSDKSLRNLSDYSKLKAAVKARIDSRYIVSDYILFIALKTGLRTGENLGLTWDCIDFENKVIKTYRRYDSTKKRFTSPKTETSVREVPIDDEACSVLKQLKRVQKRSLKETNTSNPDDFIYFDSNYGVPTSANVNKLLRQLLKEEKIEPRRLSLTGLRHTYASYLLANNIDIWVVSNVMGHKDIEQVTKTYGHLLEEKRDKGFELIRHNL